MYKKKDDVHRPTVRMNNKTPATFNELTKSQIIKAKKDQEKTGRVFYFILIQFFCISDNEYNCLYLQNLFLFQFYRQSFFTYSPMIFKTLLSKLKKL
jgi:hypothetical protein